MFVTVSIEEKVTVSPKYLDCNVNDYIKHRLSDICEGKCMNYGFVKPGSINVLKIDSGKVALNTLNGHVVYNVTFEAVICNPQKNVDIVQGVVKGVNRFGALTEVYTSVNGADIPIMDVIVPLKNRSDEEQVRISALVVGTTVDVVIRGCQFNLGDQKITAYGDLIDNVEDNIVGGDGRSDAGASLPVDDDDYLDVPMHDVMDDDASDISGNDSDVDMEDADADADDPEEDEEEEEEDDASASDDDDDVDEEPSDNESVA